LFEIVELDRTGDRVGGAATQVSLVINRRGAMWAKIDARRQSRRGSGINVVSLVWNIR
jgi:hypothetical protein